MLIFCVNIQTTSRLFVWSCSSWSRLLNEENLSATIIYQTTVCFNMTESRCTKQLGEEMTFPVGCGRTRLVCGQLFPQRRDHTQQHVATKKSAAQRLLSECSPALWGRWENVWLTLWTFSESRWGHHCREWTGLLSRWLLRKCWSLTETVELLHSWISWGCC